MFPVGASLFGITCTFAVALDREGEVSGDVVDTSLHIDARQALFSCLQNSSSTSPYRSSSNSKFSLTRPFVSLQRNVTVSAMAQAEYDADAVEVRQIGRVLVCDGVRARPPTVVRRYWSRSGSWPE
ncbi:hypothetical protein FIBSPDRAFT_268318 [Athelia psychrophila]|uniref:Uncharacterized protein n=1 Tax=Athelia psychrophila TaxID=1759441 RepID=A0A166RI39_9AGAM|nr:hypothetical protein FIBSPDRAFT_268318 [Fibularhizoctonia sp. CBS 109695]